MSDDSLVKGLRYRAQPEGFDTDELGRILEAEYIKLGRETKYTQKTSFAPSGIGYGKSTCARYWYHAFTGCEFDQSETTAKQIAGMEAGTASGKRIASLFESAGLSAGTEVDIRMEDPPIHGYMDVMVNWNGREIPGEIKTTRQEMFILRENGMKPTIYNLFQILIYMKATNKQLGFLLYENKNDQTFLIIPVEWTPFYEAMLEDALTWMRLVRKTWEDGDVPNRGFPTKRNKNCRQCPVRKTCWADDAPEATVTIPLMATPKL